MRDFLGLTPTRNPSQLKQPTSVLNNMGDAENISSEEQGPDLSINIAYQCAMKGSVTRFVTCFDSEEDPYHEVGILF